MKKVKPETWCEKLSQNVCAPSNCVITPGPEVGERLFSCHELSLIGHGQSQTSVSQSGDKISILASLAAIRRDQTLCSGSRPMGGPAHSSGPIRNQGNSRNACLRPNIIYFCCPGSLCLAVWPPIFTSFE